MCSLLAQLWRYIIMNNDLIIYYQLLSLAIRDRDNHAREAIELIIERIKLERKRRCHVIK